MSESDIRAERLKKLEILKAAGMDPYPAHSARDIANADFAASFESLAGKTMTVAGRALSIRGQGGIMFADLFDGTGRVQAVFQKGETQESDFALFATTADAGDFLEVTGEPYITKRGEKSLLVRTWRMLAKTLLPIPEAHFGLKDEEKILRERYLDILLNAEVRAMFERRARFWQAIRDFYRARGFLEVETPVLESAPGGADARPFQTHHNALDIDVYLRISAGELWQKKLLVAGYPKVFEIGRIFRNEGQSREHLQDYAQLESYEAFSDLKKGGPFVQELYRHIVKEVYGRYTFEINDHAVDFAAEWPVIDFCSIIREKFGIDPLSCTDAEAVKAVRDAKIEYGEALNKARAIDHLWKSLRKTISGPAFLVGVPVFLEPLAKRYAGNPETVERLQVIIAGSEVGKGYSELNDPQDQLMRFSEQQAMRDAGDDEAQRLDTEFIRALEYGMPPAFGFGVSERLFAFLENRPAHEAQLFPLLRPKQ
jgi:lysyl-tRNA synthetase class 2